MCGSRRPGNGTSPQTGSRNSFHPSGGRLHCYHHRLLPPIASTTTLETGANAVMRPCRALRHSSGIHRHRPRAIAHQWRPCSSRIAKQPNNDHDATKTHDAQSARGLHVNAEAKSVETAVGELPLSPVMDPLFWEARDRYKKKKPKPGAPQNVFEREFGKNAFGKHRRVYLCHELYQ